MQAGYQHSLVSSCIFYNSSIKLFCPCRNILFHNIFFYSLKSLLLSTINYDFMWLWVSTEPTSIDFFEILSKHHSPYTSLISFLFSETISLVGMFYKHVDRQKCWEYKKLCCVALGSSKKCMCGVYQRMAEGKFWFLLLGHIFKLFTTRGRWSMYRKCSLEVWFLP